MSEINYHYQIYKEIDEDLKYFFNAYLSLW